MGNPLAIMSDEKLLDAVRSGDRAAFETLVLKYQNLATSVAYSGTGDLGQSEDLAQQAFLIAWQKQNEIGDGNRFAGWLCGIVKNLARNARRKSGTIRRTQGTNIDDVNEPSSVEVAPDKIVIAQEQQTMLWSVLERLPENYREPLILFYRENQSIEAVALSLGISEDAVKQRLSRGRAMVRDELQQFVEYALTQTQPSPAFAVAVMSALPSMTSMVGSTAGKSTAGFFSSLALKKLFGGWFMSSALIGGIGGVLGALGGMAGAWYGTKQAIKSATSEQEKKLTIQFSKKMWIAALIFTALTTTSVFVDWGAYNSIQVVVLIGTFIAYILFCSLGHNQRISEIKRSYGTEEEKQGTVQLKPVSTTSLRTNSIWASVSMWIWFVVLLLISKAWIPAAACLVYLAVQSLVIFRAAEEKTITLEQTKFMCNSIMISTLAMCAAVIVGWNYMFFVEYLPSSLRFIIPIAFGALAIVICVSIKSAVTRRIA